ncbi:hypothetical protein B0G83_115176 [Paraburkholderia sp. BL21I4N1]|nr:hypothetical protein B0G83_115176 [Paraburkholderia sp. BL21I4N1]
MEWQRHQTNQQSPKFVRLNDIQRNGLGIPTGPQVNPICLA